jgi:hypothetical protein
MRNSTRTPIEARRSCFTGQRETLREGRNSRLRSLVVINRSGVVRDVEIGLDDPAAFETFVTKMHP